MGIAGRVDSYEEAVAWADRLAELGRTDVRRALEEARDLVERVGERAPAAIRAVARRALAHALRGAHDYEGSLSVYREAMKDYAAARMGVERARTAIGLCDALINLDRGPEALALARATARTLRAAGEWRRVARLEVNIANLHLRQDRADQALAHYRAAERWFERGDHAFDLAIARFNIANLLSERGRLREAEPYFASSAALLRQEGALRALVQCRLAHAGAIARLGRIDEAMRALQDAARAAEALGEPIHEAMAAYAAARLADSIGKHAQAGPLFDRAVESFAQAVMRWDEAEALVLRARWHGRAGRVAHAEADLSVAATRFEGIGARSMGLWARLESLRLQGPRALAPAERALVRRAIEAFRRSGQGAYEAEARLLGVEEARLAGRRGAGAHLDRVRALLKRHPDPWLEQRWAIESVACGRLRGKRALERLERAAAIADLMRVRIPTETMRAAFSADQAELVECAIELALDGAGGGRAIDRARHAFLWSERAHVPRQAFRPAEIAGATAAGRLLEDVAIARAELERVDRAAQTRAKALARLQRAIEALELAGTRASRHARLRPADVTHIQRALGPDETLLEYFIGRRGARAFVLTRSRVVHVELEVSLDALRSRVFRLGRLWDRRSLVGPAGERAGGALLATERELLASLEADLLLPVMRVLDPPPAGARITIVPHEWLRDVPFHALGAGEPLGVRAAVRYLMSARELLAAGKRRTESDGAPLVVGAGSMEAPTAEEEARAIAAFYPGARLLCGSEATPDAVRARWAKARLIHLAAHAARETDEPRLSGLSLGGSRWTALDIAGLDLGAELVVLSGCRTGDAVVWGGDEAFGLLPALVGRGAGAVLVSLWPVGDAGTTEWMRTFHEALARGASKIDAWKQAVDRARATGSSAYHWAPFAMYGRRAFERSAR